MLEAANALISNNCDRLQKRLWTDRHENDLITVFSAPTGGLEANYVVRKSSNGWKMGGAGMSALCFTACTGSRNLSRRT